MSICFVFHEKGIKTFFMKNDFKTKMSIIFEKIKNKYVHWFLQQKSGGKKKMKWSKNLNNVIIELNRYIKENHLIKPKKIIDYYVNQLKHNNIKIGIGMQALRLCIIGKISGPDLFIIIEILGNSKINKRISKTLNKIND